MRITRLSTRFLILVAVAAVALFALSGIGAVLIRDNMTQNKIEKTRNLAESARDIAKSFDERSKRGEFDQETAKTMAKNTIRSMHYGDGDYMFAYDLDGTCVLHGQVIEREGKNYLSAKDAKGYAYLVDLIQAAKNGGGHVYYYFTNPRTHEDDRKVSSVVPYQPWGWMIGTGTYITDIDQQLNSLLWKLGAFGALTLGLLLIIATMVSRSIANPIRALAEITRQISSGHLNVTIPAEDRADEIGLLAQSINLLRNEALQAEQLRHNQEDNKRQAEQDRRNSLISMAGQFEGNVKSVADAIVRAAQETGGAISSMKQLAGEARRDASNGAESARQVTSNVQLVATATQDLSRSISDISTQVRQSADVAQQAVRKAEETDQLVLGLTSAVDRINEVVQLINDIAGQTNLLALNATIEAARAGDAGKGFAVVANEVKHLANQTAKATGDITDQINAVKSATENAVGAIREISDIIDRINGSTETIAHAVDEQSSATQRISQSVDEAAQGVIRLADFLNSMENVTRRVENGAETVTRSSDGLNNHSEALRSAVERFLNSVRS